MGSFSGWRFVGCLCPGLLLPILLGCRFSVSAVRFFTLKFPFEIPLIFFTAFNFLQPVFQPKFPIMPSTKTTLASLSNNTGGTAGEEKFQFAAPATPAAGAAISTKPTARSSGSTSKEPKSSGRNLRSNSNNKKTNTPLFKNRSNSTEFKLGQNGSMP